MKKIELIDQEVKVLKDIIALAVANGNRSTPIAFETSPSDYSIVCDIFNKLIAE